MTQLREAYRFYIRSTGLLVDAATPVPIPALRWPMNIPILNLDNMAPAQSALDDIELISTLRAVFSLQRKSDSRSRPQSGSAQLPSPSQSHVLRPQNASPIRRTRTPRSRRSSTHRTEGSESFSRTLFRLPELLSSHNEAEADSGQAVETNSAEQQEFVDASATVVARTESPAPAPATPKRERAASPVAPLTAPPAAVNGSPGWSRWIFNGVSRRWTVLRSRLNPEENDDEAHSGMTISPPLLPLPDF